MNISHDGSRMRDDRLSKDVGQIPTNLVFLDMAT